MRWADTADCCQVLTRLKAPCTGARMKLMKPYRVISSPRVRPPVLTSRQPTAKAAWALKPAVKPPQLFISTPKRVMRAHVSAVRRPKRWCLRASPLSRAKARMTAMPLSFSSQLPHRKSARRRQRRAERCTRGR